MIDNGIGRKAIFTLFCCNNVYFCSLINVNLIIHIHKRPEGRHTNISVTKKNLAIGLYKTSIL